MKTFQEYQAFATNLPVALRNHRERLQLPISGLQEEAGKIGSLINAAQVSGKFTLTPEQTGEVKDRLADILWYVALLCSETAIPLADVAKHSVTQVQERMQQFDPERR